MLSEHDEAWMLKAIEQAECAAKAAEVPVGAVLVKDNELIASAYNQPIQLSDPTAHAEILALRKAGEALSNYRFPGTTLYVTLEPCAMCAKALVHARIDRLVFGARDDRTGAIVSQMKLLDAAYLNHRVQYAGGLYAERCAELLKAFFRERRG